MSYSAAIVGCGMIAGHYEDYSTPSVYSHTKGYLRNGSFSRLAFVDSDPYRAALLAEKSGGVSYGGVAEMLAAFLPDVVSVCVPDNLHYDVIKEVMMSPRRPKLIFLEKPVCDTRSQLDHVLELQSKCNVPVIVNHSRRFDDGHAMVKRLLGDETMGRPVRIHIDYYGGWKHLGVHIVDVLQYFFDAPMSLIGAKYCCDSRYPGDPTLDVDATIADAAVRFSGFPEKYYQILDIDMLCQNGQIKLSDFGKRIDVFRKAVNAERESILVADANLISAAMANPMRNAISVIGQYLAGGDRHILEPYGLAQASMTMNTIWKGFELYHAQSETLAAGD